MNKKPITIKLEDIITVLPEEAFWSKIVPSGNGAVAKALKKHIGKKCVIIIAQEGSIDGFSKKQLNKYKDSLD